MLNILRRLLSRKSFTQSRKIETAAAPRFAVFLPVRLLLSITTGGAREGRRTVASTLNVSETGLALMLPMFEIGGRKLSVGTMLDVQLDIYPAGVVSMTCEVVWHRLYQTEAAKGDIVGLRITDMNHTDRARFLEYLATHGWEKAVGYQQPHAGGESL